VWIGLSPCPTCAFKIFCRPPARARVRIARVRACAHYARVCVPILHGFLACFGVKKQGVFSSSGTSNI